LRPLRDGSDAGEGPRSRDPPAFAPALKIRVHDGRVTRERGRTKVCRMFELPEALRPGDLVAVVAPSSPFEPAEFWRGLAWVRGRYRVRMSSGVLARDAYLAGDDARRTRELTLAMQSTEVKAIVCARGGYGAMRVLDALPWDAFARRPKWICGFSDVTALHVEAQLRGVASIHAPHVTGLGRDAPPISRAAWIAALERPTAERVWGGLVSIHPGRASGPLVGGNLALLAAMAGAGRLRIPAGALLALEDVTERPYRIDRMLTSLRMAGHLSRVAGIVVGDFTACEPGADGRTAFEVLHERTRDLGIPVLMGAPFGHGTRNDAFILGAPAEIAEHTVRIL
jgi:muramoyltetrapeptide carboxypeptidase